MSRELSTFAAHCRRMADSKPGDRVLMDLGGGNVQRVKVGAIPEGERTLWRRFAEESEAYLARAKGSGDDREPTPEDQPFDLPV